MPLPIKSTKEVIGICSNWFKDLPSEVQVRVKEHSRFFISCPAVHVVFELNKILNAAYLHLISNNISNEKKKKKNEKRNRSQGRKRNEACSKKHMKNERAMRRDKKPLLFVVFYYLFIYLSKLLLITYFVLFCFLNK